MSDSKGPEITLAMLYQAIMAVAEGQTELRSLWLESEETLRRQLAKHTEDISDLELRAEDHEQQIRSLRKSRHQHANDLTKLSGMAEESDVRLKVLEQLRFNDRIEELEVRAGIRERRETEMRPPPMPEPPSDG